MPLAAVRNPPISIISLSGHLWMPLCYERELSIIVIIANIALGKEKVLKGVQILCGRFFSRYNVSNLGYMLELN